MRLSVSFSELVRLTLPRRVTLCSYVCGCL
jgi:hypothetical protein